MAVKLGDHLYQLDIPLVGNPLKNLNSYLITGERNLLIDTGFRQDPCREAMERQLRELNVDLARTDLFLTHLHSDHTGLSSELHRPGCAVFISRTDGETMLSHNNDDFWRRRNESYIREGFSRAEMDALWGTNPAQSAAPPPAAHYDLLDDGDELSYGGYRLRCVLTPGHTPGHMCLNDETQGVFFAGDHVLFHISPNICRWEEMPDALGSYLESLKRVRDLPAERLYPAHRAWGGTLQGRVDELLTHHDQRLKDTMQVVSDRPGMTAYEIAGAMRWQIRCKSWEDFPLTQKFFAVGEALSHLDHLRLRGLLRAEPEGGVFRWYRSSPERGQDYHREGS